MTTLFETEAGGTRYSVRQAGASLRLYSNGVFHSQWNPERPFAGGIWDCLSLPALYRPRVEMRRILLLGVGGGAVVRQLERLLPFGSLTGVDLDGVHLNIARDWFGVNDARVELIESEAAAWLGAYGGEPFDLVIDDVFTHVEGEPIRAIGLDDAWVAELTKALAPEGVLIVNAVSSRQLKRAVPVLRAAGLQFGQRWTQPTYANAIGALSRQPLLPAVWLTQLAACQLPAPVARSAKRPERRALR